MIRAILLAAVLGSGFGASAEEGEDAARRIVSNLEKAWNQGDARAWGKDFSEDAEFINILGAVFNRQELEARHADIFAGVFKGSRAEFQIRRLWRPAPSVIVIESDASVAGAPVLPPGIQADPDGSLRTRFKHILTKRSGRWWIVASQNTQRRPAPPGK
jgi:uncharacterized protein (TIGR02246 family)